VAALTQWQTSLNGATWVDTSSLFTMNNMPDLLPDALSIQYGSMYNLFSCAIGERSRIFEPTYGMYWKQALQEPIDNITATKMQIGMIQALARWEPRIQVDVANSYVTPDLSLPGYQVQIAFTLGLTSQRQAVSFAVTT
jgi:phage baseplate assembly protein W